MALLHRRRVAVVILTVTSLLCFYILEKPLSWPIDFPLKHLISTSGRDSEDILVVKGDGIKTLTPPTFVTSLPYPKPALVKDLKGQAPNLQDKVRTEPHAHTQKPSLSNENTSSEAPGGLKPAPNDVIEGSIYTATHEEDGTSGNTNKSRILGAILSTKSPVVHAEGPTEPPFIGDAYSREDVQPQTICPDGVRSRVPKSDFSERFLRNIPVLQTRNDVTLENYERLKAYPGAHGWANVNYDTLMESLSVLNSSVSSLMFDDWKKRVTITHHISNTNSVTNTSRPIDSSRSEISSIRSSVSASVNVNVNVNASRCITCAVVGNGGILKDSKRGQEIDGHHYVFRTNGAVIKGFEADVGTRTTHYIFSTNTLMNSMRSYKGVGYTGPPISQETRYVFLPDHDRDYLFMEAAAKHTVVDRGTDKGQDPSKYFGSDISAAKLKMYHPDFIRYLRNRFLRSSALKTRYKNIYRPSTGAVMLLGAMHTCDQVSAYGFMTPDYQKFSDHYFDASFRPVGFFINHDLRLEMNLWQDLHKDGLISLYMHKENN